jgi:polyhydroxyalkanoate synthesis regulator phasin
MAKLSSKWLALAGLLSLGATSLFAQDNKALIDLLIKKGVLTDAEAAKVAAEVAKANAGNDVATNASDKFLKKLTLSGRIQIQFADLGTNINGAAAQPVSTEHFLMRRVYFGFKADFGNGWTGVINYDLANASFDLGYIEWKQSDALFVDTGFRRVPIGLEEWGTSSANLRAIERSPATRYFVESNNGRRLGAGAYRIGVFAGGADSGFTYNFAVTNSERDEFSSLNGNSDPGVQGSGTASNNTPSLWGNVGYGDKFPGGTYKVGASAGYLPDQGGPGSVVGQGNGITVYNLYGVWTMGGFDLEGEYFWADDHHGASATTDARPSAYWIQPAYRVGDWEAVVRYSYVDSDGRGVNISDGTRSAPSGGTMNKMSEWFIGGNWYIKSNDVKLQLGYIHSESKDTVTGASASAKADGVRSQMQVSF